MKRSPEYAAVRKGIADPKPVDAWQAHGLHYFVFQMAKVDGITEGPYALFTMRWEDERPVSAMIVTPNASTDENGAQSALPAMAGT